MAKRTEDLLLTSRISVLLEKITTSGKFSPDRTLLQELCTSICNDPSLIDHCFRFLSIQLQREHAQIRLGVVRLFSGLSKPSYIRQHLIDSVESTSIQNVCLRLRNLFLTHIQDWTSLALVVNSDSPPLPPPVEAARELQLCFLNLILDWEADLKAGQFEAPVLPSGTGSFSETPLVWTLSGLARGQLRGFLTYLRSTSSRTVQIQSSTDSKQLRLSELISKLEQTREAQIRKARAKFQVAANAYNRRLKRCLREITDAGERVEENLVALDSLLQLLVPDPFSDGTVDKLQSPHSPLNDPMADSRAHGRLCGTSSGVNFGAPVVQVHLPCVPGTELSELEPCIPVRMTEDVRLLESSAREHAVVSRDKHLPLLIGWLKVLNSEDAANVGPDLRSQVDLQLHRVRQWLARTDTSTHLFFHRLMFTEEPKDSTSPIPDRDISAATPPDSSDTSDFEDVEPSGVQQINEDEDSVRSSLSTSGAIGECDPSLELNRGFACEESKDVVINSETVNSVEESIRRQSSRDDVAYQTNLEILPTKSTVVWRAVESLHGFWRPIDPQEYETPTDYLEHALSCTGGTPFSENSGVPVAGTSSYTSSTEPPTADVKDSVPPLQNLRCWAPLLSGRLCLRRDLSGRCPIHGIIVRRDPQTGRPVDPKDREMLQAELTHVHQARQNERLRLEKRQARRKYPGLVDLKNPTKTAHGRLRSRVLSKRSLRKVCDLLDSEDNKAIAARFSDNYIHAVKPK